MWFVSFLTIALISPFKAFLVLLLLLLFFPVLGTEPRTWCTLGKHWATPSPDYIVSKVTSSFLLIRISFLGGRYQGTGGREEVEPVRAKVAIRSFNCFTVEWFCCVAAGPRIFFFWRKLWNWIFNGLIFNCVWKCVRTCEGSTHEVQKKALDSPGAGVNSGYEPSDVYTGNWTPHLGSLEEQ